LYWSEIIQFRPHFAEGVDSQPCAGYGTVVFRSKAVDFAGAAQRFLPEGAGFLRIHGDPGLCLAKRSANPGGVERASDGECPVNRLVFVIEMES
jgi:hypothetical protein